MKSEKRELKVEKNELFGDFRVVEYVEGKWVNEYDNNWGKEEAEYQLERMLNHHEPDVY